MGNPFGGEVYPNTVGLSKKGSERKTTPYFTDVANIDNDNCIACPKGDELMQTDLDSTLSHNDVQYIRNLLAEGIARMLVEKVAKNAAPAVDSSEPERYNPSPQKEVSS